MRPVYIVVAALIGSVVLGACGTLTAQAPTTLPSVAVAPSAIMAPTTASIPTASSAAITATLAAPTATLPATKTILIPTATRQDPSPAASAAPTQLATQTEESSLVNLARTALLAQPGLGQQTLILQSEKEVEWPSSALGCPEPGKAYLQVITPGVQIIFSDGARTYDIHTTHTGDALIWCDSGTAKMIGASK